MAKIKIGIVGLHQSGKSLLINCLLKRNISKVGDGNATTHTAVIYSYSKDEYASFKDSLGYHDNIEVESVRELTANDSVERIEVFLDNPLLRNFTLLDLPGTGYNEADNAVMLTSMADVDCVILVATNDKELTSASSFYSNTLSVLKARGIPYYFVMNCVNSDYWYPLHKHNIALLDSDMELLQSYEPLSLDENPVLNLMWYWCSVADTEDDLYKEYIDDITFNFDHRRKNFSMDFLRESSRFFIIEEIFSRGNKHFLELKKEMRGELSKLQEQICPVGTIQTFSFNTIPDGWLYCDGSSKDITSFPELYDKIGTTFGGDGVNTFVLPDLRGQFVRGWDRDGVVDGDYSFGRNQEDSIQGHEHKCEEIQTSSNGSHSHNLYHNENTSYHSDSKRKVRVPSREYTNYYDYDSSFISDAGSHSHSIGAHQSTSIVASTYGKVRISRETRPKNVALLFCIKSSSGNCYISKKKKLPVLELSNLFVSEEGKLHEGYVFLSSEFVLKFKGNTSSQFLDVEIFNEDGNLQNYYTNVVGDDPIRIPSAALCYVQYWFAGSKVSNVSKAKLSIHRIKSMGVIGDFNNWENSVEMSDDSNLRFSCIVELNQGNKFKFRANNQWGIDLGGDFDNLLPSASDLVCKDSGKYEIILDLSMLPWHCELKKKGKGNSVKKTHSHTVLSDSELELQNILSKINYKF